MGKVLFTKTWVWCGGTQPSEERDGDNQVTQRFFAQGFQTLAPYSSLPASFYYTNDHLGSIREVLDATGTLRARYDYDAWGNRTKLSGDVEADFGFTGHLHHKQTGLILTHYRAYDPRLARWLSRDPMFEITGELAEISQGSNLYAYVSNDPANWIDPTGLGKIGFCIKTVKGIWKKVGKDRARKELAEKGDVLVQGAGSSKDAKNMAREVFGDKTTRHDPHQAGQKPHYQHKNGGRGHVFYKTLAAATAINWLGDNALGNTIDFFNPLSDVKDVIDLANELLASGDEEESCECP